VSVVAFLRAYRTNECVPAFCQTKTVKLTAVENGYRYKTTVNPGATVTVTPTNKGKGDAFMFYPASFRTAIASGRCPDTLPTIVGQVGKYLQGDVSPAVRAGVGPLLVLVVPCFLRCLDITHHPRLALLSCCPALGMAWFVVFSDVTLACFLLFFCFSSILAFFPFSLNSWRV